jgi:hypothetical protein
MKNGLGVSRVRRLVPHARYEIPHKVVTAIQRQGAISAWHEYFFRSASAKWEA